MANETGVVGVQYTEEAQLRVGGACEGLNGRYKADGRIDVGLGKAFRLVELLIFLEVLFLINCWGKPNISISRGHQQLLPSSSLICVCLTSFPVCAGPRWDRPFIVTCDASAEGFGGHLAQRGDNGTRRVGPGGYKASLN